MPTTFSKLWKSRSAILKGWKGPSITPVIRVWYYPEANPPVMTVRFQCPKFLWELETDQGETIEAWEWPDGHTLTDSSTLLAPWNRPRPRSTSPYHAPDADDIPF